ncbi:hypothetical protein [Salinigranum halophilum]|jgi:hypothetical protein|uniref:hypothetical protein n=1 Tax=Salinigranum halophilum TaxID=2565931 RepID=UPI00191C05C8|nr:hypothetical protein [Salinigranum halophilum]
MGEHASRVQSALRERLASAVEHLVWHVEYDLDGTPVDVAGVSDSTLVLVELEWRRADPVDNTATLFRHLADGVLRASTDRTVVVVQLFTAYYDLVRGGVSSKRQNAEFVGDRIATAVPHVSYHGVSLPLSPPRADGDLPDDWRDAVETAVGSVSDALRSREQAHDGREQREETGGRS